MNRKLSTVEKSAAALCSRIKENPYTTQAQIRALFWEQHPEFAPHYRSKKRQNQYGATIRSAFVDFVDHLQRSGDITDKLANRVTL